MLGEVFESPRTHRNPEDYCNPIGGLGLTSAITAQPSACACNCIYLHTIKYS